MEKIIQNRTHSLCKLTLAMLAAMLLVSPAQAALVLQFGQDGTAGVTNFSAQPNDTLQVEVYITQTDGDTRLSDQGLSSFQFDFTIGGDGSVIHGPQGSFMFQDGLDNFATEARTDQLLDVGAFADNDPSDATGTKVIPVKAPTILLGIATVNVGETASGDYSFAIAPASDATSFSTGDDPFRGSVTVDPGSATLTVNATAVPEPSYLAIAVAGLALRLRRSWRQKAS